MKILLIGYITCFFFIINLWNLVFLTSQFRLVIFQVLQLHVVLNRAAPQQNYSALWWAISHCICLAFGCSTLCSFLLQQMFIVLLLFVKWCAYTKNTTCTKGPALLSLENWSRDIILINCSKAVHLEDLEIQRDGKM